MRRRERKLGPRAELTRLILRFALLFLAVTIVLVAVWSFLAPAYTAAVGGLAGRLLHLFEAPNVSVLEVRGAEIWIYRVVGPGKIAPFTWFDRYTFFAVIPLLALLVATPGLGWWRRLARAGIGIAALGLVHAAYLVASVELSYAAIGLTEVGPFLARTLDAWQIGVRVLWEAAPVAIWVLLTAAVWKRVFRASRPERGSERLSASAMEASG